MITRLTALLTILPTGQTRNRIRLVTRCDMLRPLRSITYAAVIVHTNCLDKRESERSFRNTGIGGCVRLVAVFFATFFREDAICIHCSHPPVVLFLLLSSRIIRNALSFYIFFKGERCSAILCVTDK